MLRLISYERVSTEDQVDYGTGLETQSLENEAYARRHGFVIVAHEQDPGVSGTIYPRDGLERAVARLQRKEADGIIVHRVDRLGRVAYIPMVFWDRLSTMRVRLYSAQDGEVNNGNIILFALRCAMAQTDYQQIVTNLRAGRFRLAESGLAPSRAFSPYGYHIVQKIENGIVQPNPGTYLVVEEQAAIVRLIFSLYAAGVSLYAIRARLEEMGVPPPGTAVAADVPVWHRATVLRILRNPCYKGTAVWGQYEYKTIDKSKMSPEETLHLRKATGKYTRRTLAPASAHVTIPIPQIVEGETWEKCQVRRSENQAQTQRNDRKHLLSGLLMCPTCGDRLIVARGRGEIQREIYYKCYRRNVKINTCDRTNHKESTIRAELLLNLQRIASDPNFAATAYSAYLGIEDPDAPGTLASAQFQLKELHSREDATVRAQISALQTGARAEIYLGILQDISADRQRLEQKIMEAATAAAHRKQAESINIAEAAKIFADLILEALQDDQLTSLEKNAILRRTIKSIVPETGGYCITMRPFTGSEAMLVVASAETHATTNTISVRFEAG